MKTAKILTTLIFFGIVHSGFSVLDGDCQLQSPTREDKLVKIAPKNIKDSCSEAERKFRIYLARFSPKELRDTAFLKSNGLRVGHFWIGDLGPDSAEYAIIYYRCFESGYLAVFKKNQKQEREFLWQSPDLGDGSNLANIREPEDINGDAKKEIFFYQPGGSAMNMILDLYTWDGNTARYIGQFSGNSIEIKDLNADGTKEIIESNRRYIWNKAGDTLLIESGFYRWEENTYKHYDSERTAKPIKD